MKDLNSEFKNFLFNLNLYKYIPFADAIIAADCDKCNQYKNIWKENGIPFNHGCILYFITKISPYSKEVRETKHGFVSPCKWVIDNYSKFKKYFN